jgi:hypothetical protein
MTDQETLQVVLSEPDNRYLARLVCWVFTIGGDPAFILSPRDSSDLNSLLDAFKRGPDPTDFNLLIGVRGPTSPPEMCNGLVLPMVTVDQLYSFPLGALLSEIEMPEGANAKTFTASAEELFWRIQRLTENRGADDNHRALNYLAVRVDSIYTLFANKQTENSSLSALNVRSRVTAGGRKLVDVVLTFRNRQSGLTEKYYARVDVSELFPFLVNTISPYYDLD